MKTIDDIIKHIPTDLNPQGAEELDEATLADPFDPADDTLAVPTDAFGAALWRLELLQNMADCGY